MVVPPAPTESSTSTSDGNNNNNTPQHQASESMPPDQQKESSATASTAPAGDESGGYTPTLQAVTAPSLVPPPITAATAEGSAPPEQVYIPQPQTHYYGGADELNAQFQSMGLQQPTETEVGTEADHQPFDHTEGTDESPAEQPVKLFVGQVS